MASHRNGVARCCRWLVPVVLAFSCGDCAALWGFDDATTVRDAAPADATPRDAGLFVADATTPPHDAQPAERDAALHVARDTGAPSQCAPACLVGSTCEKAIGGESVCVDPSATCNDSSSCTGPHCCVWLDDTSATGQCLTSTSVAPTVSCLCVHGSAGAGQGTCPICTKAPGDPGTGIMTCRAF